MGLDVSGTLEGAGGVGGLIFERNFYANKTFAVGSDLNGNVARLVDVSTGQSVADYEYGPFGEQIRASGEYAALNPFGFSSKFTDWETGLLYYGYRYYNPSTGRWLSRDPIEEDGGVNLYGFCENNGIDSWDFLGQEAYAFYMNTSKLSEDHRLEVGFFRNCAIASAGVLQGYLNSIQEKILFGRLGS